MKTILIIDDEPTYLQTVTGMVRNNGYEVIEADDGLKGVKLARSEQPDLVLCDLGMEPVDGFMVLSILRGYPGTRRIPFIIVSGLGDKDNLRRGLALGADGFITKPFAPKEFFESVETWLSRREKSLQHAEEKIEILRGRMSDPLPEEINNSLSDISAVGRQINTGTDATLSARLAWQVRCLQYEIRHASVFSQLQAIGDDPDAAELLRHERGITNALLVKDSTEGMAREFQIDVELQLNADVRSIAMDATYAGFILEAVLFSHIRSFGPAPRIRVISEKLGKTLMIAVEGSSASAGGAPPSVARETSLGMRCAQTLAGFLDGSVSEQRTGAAHQVRINFPDPGGKG